MAPISKGILRPQYLTDLQISKAYNFFIMIFVI